MGQYLGKCKRHTRTLCLRPFFSFESKTSSSHHLTSFFPGALPSTRRPCQRRPSLLSMERREQEGIQVRSLPGFPVIMRCVALMDSDDGFESVVYDGRCRLGVGVDGTSLAHDSGGRVLLFGACSSKVRLITYMAFADVCGCRLISGTARC